VINHLLVVLSNIFKQDEGTIQIHLYCNLDLLFTVIFFEIHSERKNTTGLKHDSQYLLGLPMSKGDES
jgi:hypothetical protein